MDHEIKNSLKPVFDQICFLGRKYEISTVFDDFLTAALNFFTVPGAEPHNIRTFDN